MKTVLIFILLVVVVGAVLFGGVKGIMWLIEFRPKTLIYTLCGLIALVLLMGLWAIAKEISS